MFATALEIIVDAIMIMIMSVIATVLPLKMKTDVVILILIQEYHNDLLEPLNLKPLGSRLNNKLINTIFWGAG